ncbi:MAG TPA: hypothetical protein DEO85_13820 [Maritimibacter sp.]|nr:hypothetical protein [Maritimibacter sp.]
MKPVLSLAALALVTLAACSEQDMCIYRATQDLKTAERRISTLEGNVARGYAIHRSQERITYTGVCYDKAGDPYECPKTRWETVETPVSIDVPDQRRQLSDLRAQIPALTRAAANAQAQCRQAYPE